MNNRSPKVIGSSLVLMTCLCMVKHVYAQNLAFKSQPKSVKVEEKDANVLSLIEILDRIEQHYNVTFAYQKKFLSGKSASYPLMLKLGLEAFLTEILTPHKLKFKKIEQVAENIYIISPEELLVAESSAETDNLKVGTDANDVTESPDYALYGSIKGLSDNNPLPGVNVILQGTEVGTTTDQWGNFLLSIPRNRENVIVVSHIGFETETLHVNSATRLDVVLRENIQSLSEVVITALGINREQKTLGYAVSKVNGDQLSIVGNTNVASALYGKAPGVRIRTAPGGATSAVTVQVRGLNSLNYSTQPLYIIDGVVMRDGNEKGAAGINNDDYYTDGRIRGNGILDINPTDIETLTVLKGASATALYGSDASGGVILINTKRGVKKPGLGIEINYQATQEEVAFTPHYQNVYGPGFDRSRNITLGASGDGWVPVDVDGDGNIDGQRPLFESHAQFGPKMNGQQVYWWDGTLRDYSPEPNNYKDFYRKGYSSAFNFSVSNQISKWAYHLSYTRRDYEGIQVGGKMNRNTVNFSTTVKPSTKLNVDLSVNYTNSFVHNRPLKINRLTSSWTGFFSRAEKMSLFFDKYKTSDGYKWVPFDQQQENPEEALKFTTPQGYEVMNLLWQQLRDSEDECQDRVITSFTVDYDILKNLRFRARSGNDITVLKTETRGYTQIPAEFSTTRTGNYGIANGHYNVLYGDALLSYNHSVANFLKVSGSLGFQVRDEKYQNESASTSGGLVLENWFTLSNSYNPTLTTTQSTINILKYAGLGIVDISYKDYLFLQGTGRQEYSSTLPPNNNGYFYPSVNSGFIFSEAFKMPAFLNYGKLRASFGIVGNAPPAYESNILYTPTNLQTSNGIVNSATASGSLFGNNKIRPERKHEAEFGIDTRLFHHKLGIDLSYYVSRTYDQILKLDIPGSAGAEKILTNVGKLGSQGWELGLNFSPVSGQLVWTTGLNAAYNTTRMLSLPKGNDKLVLKELEGNSIQLVAEEGQSLGNIYVYPRMTDEKGNLIIGENGLYVIDHSRYVKAGNLLPKVTGGFTNTITYKNFSLECNLDYSLGGQIISPALKYGVAAGLYESTLQYRDASHGGLPYYISENGNKILLSNNDTSTPSNSEVYHDGILLDGVRADGSVNTTIVDAASYYINTFYWGHNAWNEKGAIYDNSYIKVREVVLGYTIPQKISDRMHFTSIRVSLLGRNLFYVWRTLENLDPESMIGTNWLNQGIDDGSGAATRSYGFSIHLGF